MIIMYYMVAFNGHRIKTKKPSLIIIIFLSNILRPFIPFGVSVAQKRKLLTDKIV